MSMVHEPARLTKDQTYFAQVPDWIIYHPALTGNDVRMYAALIRHADDSRQCFPGRERLSDLLNQSLSSTKRQIKALEDAGALRVTPRYHPDGGQTSNHYHLVWDRPRVDGGSGSAEDRGPVLVGTGVRFGDEPLTIAIEPEPVEPEKFSFDVSRREPIPPSHAYLDGPAIRADSYVLVTEEAEPPPPISAAPPSPSQPGYADWSVICEEVGWEPQLGTAIGIRKLRQLFAARITAQQIIDCVTWLRADPFWSGKGVDIGLVQSQMQKFLTQRRATQGPSLYEETLEGVRHIFEG